MLISDWSSDVCSSDLKGNLRLDHPELGEMAGGIGVFGAEGGAEGINLAQRETVGFDIELAGHREKRFLAEEIAREIDRDVGVARQVGGVQGGHAKQDRTSTHLNSSH